MDNHDPLDDALTDLLGSHPVAIADEDRTYRHVVDRAHRHIMRRRVARAALATVIVAIIATAAAITTAHHTSEVQVRAPLPSTIGRARPASLPRAERAAQALAAQMLGETILPADAKRSAVPPPPILQGPLETPEIGNLVGVHQLWSVGEAPHSVASFAATHAPAGFTSGGGGFGSETRGSAKAWFVTQTLTAWPMNISFAELQIAVVAGDNGGSLVRADALVGWTDPRPADELVSDRDRVATITRTRGWAPPRNDGRIVVTNRQYLRTLVAAFNQLRVGPPVRSYSCGVIDATTVAYSVAFSVSPGASPDIVAGVGGCDGVGVTVNGHPAPYLEDRTGYLENIGEFRDTVARAFA